MRKSGDDDSPRPMAASPGWRPIWTSTAPSRRRPATTIWCQFIGFVARAGAREHPAAGNQHPSEDMAQAGH